MPARTAVTIGNFDGVHRAHARLIAAGREHVGRDGRVIVLAFDPHPLTVLRPNDAPARLTTFEQRSQWLHLAGADEVVRLQPSSQVLSQKPNEFIAWVADQYAPSFIVEGPDFRFGRGRAGSVATLRELEAAFNYRTVVIEPVQTQLLDQSVVHVSSSTIRWLLERGRVGDATLLLDRPYELEAKVARGDRRGRELGVPTANLDAGDLLLPGDGIYAGRAILDDSREFAAAISVGNKPTFGEHPRICEAHLIGYDGPLDDYGWGLRLQFHRWLRDQLAFADGHQLVEQLQRDIRRSAECGVLSAGCGNAPAKRPLTQHSALSTEHSCGA